MHACMKFCCAFGIFCFFSVSMASKQQHSSNIGAWPAPAEVPLVDAFVGVFASTFASGTACWCGADFNSKLRIRSTQSKRIRIPIESWHVANRTLLGGCDIEFESFHGSREVTVSNLVSAKPVWNHPCSDELHMHSRPVCIS